MILQVLPVPAVTVRPSITLESGIRSEDDLTHKLVDIIRINQKLKEALESGVPVNIIQELHELLQYHVTTYFDNEVSGLPPARHRSGRALKTLSQRLKGKEGRFRGNLSGKRVDFSARTVISPDPNIDINEVGVPLDVAQRLTIPERVTPWNIEELKQLIRNGPDQYPGALYIVRPDGRRVRLEFVTEREGLADGNSGRFHCGTPHQGRRHCPLQPPTITSPNVHNGPHRESSSLQDLQTQPMRLPTLQRRLRRRRNEPPRPTGRGSQN